MVIIRFGDKRKTAQDTSKQSRNPEVLLSSVQKCHPVPWDSTYLIPSA